MIVIRKQHAAFGGSELKWLETDNPALLAYLREKDCLFALILAFQGNADDRFGMFAKVRPGERDVARAQWRRRRGDHGERFGDDDAPRGAHRGVLSSLNQLT